MNGKSLYELVQASGLTKRDWAIRSGISERTLGNLYDASVVKRKYIEAFERAGLLQDGKISGKNEEKKASHELTKPNDYLSTIISQAQEIGSLKKELEFYKGKEGIEAIRERVRRLEISVKYILDFIGDEKSFRKALKFIDQPLSKVAVSIANAKGEVEFVNLEFTNMTGYTIDEMFGKKAGDLLQGEETESKVVKQMGDAIRNKKWFEGEVINYNKSGEKIVCKLIIAPMLDRKDNLDKIISLATFYK